MKFQIKNDQPVPVAGGEIDNVTIFDIDGAGRATGWTRQGLAALYEAVFPGDPPGADDTLLQAVQQTLGTWRDDPARVLLRQTEFAELKDPEFAVFVVKCQQRRLDPWRGEVYPLMKFEPRKGNRVALGVPIETQRAIAHSTGLYAGMDAPVHEYGDSRNPLRTLVTVYKLVNGVRMPFSAEANFEDFFPNAGEGTLASSHPHVCNATIAEAGALRRAFPRELSEIFSPLEFQGPRPGGGATAPDARPAAVSDDETPHTYMGLHMALMDLGLDKPAEREAAIADLRAQHRGLLERNERGFYARVLLAVKQEPNRWRMAAG